MHSLNYVHRDLKPGNFVVVYGKNNNEEAVVKLTDFGFSKNKENLKTLGQGTYPYMAPELWGDANQQKGHEKTYGMEVDIWSMGASSTR